MKRTWLDAVKDVVVNYGNQIQDLFTYNKAAAITLAVISFFVGALLF